MPPWRLHDLHPYAKLAMLNFAGRGGRRYYPGQFGENRGECVDMLCRRRGATPDPRAMRPVPYIDPPRSLLQKIGISVCLCPGKQVCN